MSDCFFFIIGVTFSTWQQSIKGSGNVIAYSPFERQQTIEASVKGKLVSWGENIYENTLVEKDQLIAIIKDLDENYVTRLQGKLGNTNDAISAALAQLDAYKRVLDANQLIVNNLELQLKNYTSLKQDTISTQDSFVEMAQKKLLASKQIQIQMEAAIPQLKAEFDRSKALNIKGNLSDQKFQEVERKLQEAKAKVSKSSLDVEAAKAELAGKEFDRKAKINKAQIDIDYATAMLEKAKGEISKTSADIEKVKQTITEKRKELLDLESQLARQATQEIRAPFAGFLTEVNPNLKTKILKVGDPICVIVPKTRDRAVQIWVDGNDVPLISPGRNVRLQFEGWPALQFANGWPSIALGTYGGKVVSIDAIDNGKGKFRLLVQPDKNEPAWPDSKLLKQGVKTNGWVMLNQVSLWYEIWRNLNGFPATVDLMGDEKSSSISKPPKLPK